MKIIIAVTVSVLSLLVLFFSAEKNNRENERAISSGSSSVACPTVILDAGHGGEDGGAVAPDSTNEKDINLSIVLKMTDFCRLFGVQYKTVRTQDVSVCDDGLDTVRKRKHSDIINREALVNSTDNAILLSIHQNKFESPAEHGMQVFYSANTDSSAVLAQFIQDKVRDKLQNDNKRQIKPSGDSIYLLYKAKKCAVLAECGFLSNPDELSLLKNDRYQSKLAYLIFSGLLDFINT